ncbi:MAG TPA: AzlD domain-containing protein [Anaerolineales bacterium]|nr:AzlD domain-containing protein [Anaerolineales bacterium]HLF37503.1 AzlD domain-containing protein [Anaerolineales bacterium]
MAEFTVWLVILGGMIATYLTRLSFILLIPTERVPQFLRRGLKYIPPAVLSAILLPELVILDGSLELAFSNHRLVAGIIAALVAWRLKNTWLTIATGMVALWLLMAR